MKAIFATVASLFVPGVGHLVYGSVGWAVAWFVLGILTGGITNLFAAAHTIAIAAK